MECGQMVLWMLSCIHHIFQIQVAILLLHMVLGTDQITGADGKQYQPAENLVRPGDYIVAWNDEKIENKKELFQKLSDLDEDQAGACISRWRSLSAATACSNPTVPVLIWEIQNRDEASLDLPDQHRHSTPFFRFYGCHSSPATSPK